jgi:hypothetical protein
MLSNSYQYSGKQLEKKTVSHLRDFNISFKKNFTINRYQIKYKAMMENTLAKQNLVVRPNGRFNGQEPTINIEDPETLVIIDFERNSLYKKYCLISGYIISEDGLKNFEQTGNIDISHQKSEVFKKKEGQAKIEVRTSPSFYNRLPEQARIGNK